VFFPDRVKAYREARRVLRPDGCFLFNVWSRIEDKPVPAALSDALAACFPKTRPASSTCDWTQLLTDQRSKIRLWYTAENAAGLSASGA
jgi:SAM-dependent methyltransferase